MEREYQVGAHVVYVDPKGRPHNAVVTAWWPGEYSSGMTCDVDGQPLERPLTGGDPNGVNLVYVSPDEGKQDPYGRQIERETSVVHKSLQPAHGNFWCWSDEVGF